MACFIVFRHLVFVGSEVDPECFPVAKEAALRYFVKLALDAETEAELSR